MARIWITEVVCHPDVEHKIWVKHHIRLDEVREAVCFGAGEEERWATDSQRGRRLLVKGTSAGGLRLVAFLRPEDRISGVWRCTTAMRESEIYG